MKALRLLRWSGSVLSPRTRPCLVHLLQQPLSNRRFLSAAASPLQQAIQYQDQEHDAEEDLWGSSQAHKGDDPVIPEDMPQSLQQEARLRALPSPPLSAAKSSAKLAALHARLSFSPRLPIETLARCLVDATADSNPDFNNTSLAILGRDLYSFYTSEAILCRYPRLPTAVVFAAMAAYIGPKTLTQITKEWGVELVAEPGGEVDPGYLQCRREDSMLIRKHSPDSDTDPTSAVEEGQPPIAGANRPNAEQKSWRRGVSSMTVYDDEFGDLVKGSARGGRSKAATTTVEDACARFVQAVMGAVYLHRGKNAAKLFFKEHILSRHLNVGKMFEFKQPTRDLSRLCAREGFESPVARILSETGRATRHPVFVVGVFAGREKLGEGAGSSLNEARIRAAVGALKGWYLYSPLEVRVPSDVEGANARPWKPVLVDIGEIIV
ncbi:54S ribosomal protein L3 mitochondrial [Xanthoria parietina]